MSEETPTRALRPDAQGFDEVRIFTHPRYKTSSLSGDEWRISAVIQLWRKGSLKHEESFHDIETAAKFLPFVLARAGDDGKAYFGGEGDLCDQEGCADKATVVYQLKKHYCSGPGNCGMEGKKYGEKIRMFCGNHSRRGDCGLEDADENYQLLEGFPIEPREEDKKESVFGGVIKLP